MSSTRRSFGWRPLPRPDALTSAVLVFPLFAIYQVGLLLGARGSNGVDFISRLLAELVQRDFTAYIQVLAGMVAVYALTLFGLRRRGSFRPRDFLPILIEAAIYALAMGSLILFVIQRFLDFVPGLVIGAANPVEVWVISAGAGFHEELVFRVFQMGGLVKLFQSLTGKRRAWLYALAVSSLLFSLVHHIGASAEPFTAMAFSYRILAGVYFGALYQLRGFAVAAWTHCLYDVYVLTFAG